MGNQQLAQRIVRGFIDDMPRQIALLAQAVNDGDAGQVRLVAHSIKGAASSVCGLEVQEVARNLEQMGRAGDLTATDCRIAGVVGKLCAREACDGEVLTPGA